MPSRSLRLKKMN